jgi:methionyl-tRNA formyltransferase
MSSDELRIVVAGSVSFSERTLRGLIRHGARVVGVLGLARAASPGVSDYADLGPVAAEAGIPFVEFRKINAPEVLEAVRSWQPDVLFVVGLSQMVEAPLMGLATRGAIGFHPTPLPRWRGRAPISWLTYDEQPGAATFFVIEERVDAGAIFVQEPFDVPRGAYAGEVVAAARDAIDRALDRWLPELLRGKWDPSPQDESLASWIGRRAPEDGLIEWRDSACDILRLVRAAARPYPGAYTYYRNRRLTVWRAVLSPAPFRGVSGRVLDASNGLLVQTGDGLIGITEWELENADGINPRIPVGTKLGYSIDHELNQLRSRVADLERQLATHAGRATNARSDE